MKTTYSSVMAGPDISSWSKRLSLAKQEAKESGRISGDVDLCVEVSEILKANGLPEIKRAGLNHWINGARPPNVKQLIILCHVLGISPARLFEEELSRFSIRKDPLMEQAIAILKEQDEIGKQRAISGMQVALHGYEPKKGRRLSSG